MLRYKYWILGICGIAFFVTFFYQFFTKHLKSQSELRFLITTPDIVLPTKILEENTIASNIFDPNISRIKSFATSQELIKYIADTLHLDKHYNISSRDDKEQIEYDVAHQLRDNYDFKVNEQKEIIISAKDKNSSWAKKISHNIMNKLNDMNNEYFISIIKTQEKVSQKHLARLNKQKSALADSLKRINAQLRKLPIPADIVIKLIKNEECPECPVYFNNLLLTEYITSKQSITLKMSAIDDNIEKFLEKTYQSQISLELIKEKKPIILEEKIAVPSKKMYLDYLVNSAKATGIAFFVLCLVLYIALPEIKTISKFFPNGSNGSEKPFAEFSSKEKAEH